MIEQVIEPPDRASLPAWHDGDAFLAGGSWLFSEAQPDLRRLVDLRSLDWPPITEHADGIELAATCTIAELARVSAAWPAARIVRECCESLLGSFKVWNVATVGGNICLALPAGPMTSLCAGLDATATVWTPDGGVRTQPVAQFVLGHRRTTLRPGEVLRAVSLPASALREPIAVRQFSLTNLGRSAVLLVARRTPSAVRLAITASTVCPVVLDLEPGAEPGAQIDDAVAGRWHDDVHGDPVWRRHLTHRLARELLAELS